MSGSLFAPPVFCGGRAEDIVEWIEDFELAANINGWVGERQAVFAAGLLRDNAKMWYRNLSETTKGSWPHLRMSLLAEYQCNGNDDLIREQLYSRQQSANESVMDFAKDIRGLLSKMKIKLSDEEATFLFRRGLHVNEQRWVRLNKPGTFAEAIDLAVQAEEAYNIDTVPEVRKPMPKTHFPSQLERHAPVRQTRDTAGMTQEDRHLEKKVDELAKQLERISLQLHQGRQEPGLLRVRSCFECGQPGHVAKYCPQRSNTYRRQEFNRSEPRINDQNIQRRNNDIHVLQRREMENRNQEQPEMNRALNGGVQPRRVGSHDRQ